MYIVSNNVHIHMYIYSNMYMCTYAYICVYIYIYVHIYLCTCKCRYVYTYIYMYTCLYVCMYVCIYIYILGMYICDTHVQARIASPWLCLVGYLRFAMNIHQKRKVPSGNSTQLWKSLSLIGIINYKLAIFYSYV